MRFPPDVHAHRNVRECWLPLPGVPNRCLVSHTRRCTSPVRPASTSNRKELFAQLDPTLRGLERPSAPSLAAVRVRDPHSNRLPVPPARSFSLPGGTRTVTHLALPRDELPLLAFPKIAPSSLPNRRVHSRVGSLQSFVGPPLRFPNVPTLRFHTTSPVFSSSILSALLQRLTTLGFIVRFTGCLPVIADREPSGSPRCSSALRSFPSDPGCCRRTRRFVRGDSHLQPDRHPALLPTACAVGLEARHFRRPEGPLKSRPERSHAPEVHQPPYRLAVQSIARPPCGALALDREPRGFSPMSGPLRGRRFQRSVPGAPVGLGSSLAFSPHVPKIALLEEREESVRQRSGPEDPPFGF